MRAVSVIATGAISALGSGRAAYAVGGPGTKPVSVVEEAPWLRAAGLRRPRAALVGPPAIRERSAALVDPAAALLDVSVMELAAQLDRVRPAWRTERVAICLGTSSGGMASQLESFALLERGLPVPGDLAMRGLYGGPLCGIRDRLGLGPGVTVQLLAACASSTFALGVGCRWLECDAADIVIAGGYDAVTLLVAAGFEALGATSASRPRPFCQDRDGLSLGDGAAVLALAACEDSQSCSAVVGFGASSDAYHPTAPDPSGSGLALAAQRALSDAGIHPSEVRLVSAHGTATSFNDATEARALRALELEHAVIHPFKSVVGHTLGAAGALEVLALLDAAREGVLPASAAWERLELEVEGRIFVETRSGMPLPAIKLAAAFGGANAALVLGASSRARRTDPRPVSIAAIGEPCETSDPDLVLAAGGSLHRDRLLRLDALSGLAVTSVASVLRGNCSIPHPERCGVVLGTVAATVEENAIFDERRRRRGGSFVEPRRFPATSPNVGAGYVAQAFGYRGPNVAVGGRGTSALEALLIAHDLVACGDAEHCWCIVADVVGGVVARLWQHAGLPLPSTGAVAVLLRPAGTRTRGRLRRSRLESGLIEVSASLGSSELVSGPGWISLLKVLPSAAEGW